MTSTARTRSTSPCRNTGDPTGAWTIYHVPAQNDGTDGTPNHGCTLDGTAHGPCFQDYPHIGADANGVYVTTNEYDLFGPSFNAAQIFAFSKAQLAAHPASINVTLVENLNVDGSPGFTVWPATSPAGQYSSERERHRVPPEHHRRRRLARPATRPAPPAASASGRSPTRSRSTRRRRRSASPAGWSTARRTCSRRSRTRSPATSRSGSASTTPRRRRSSARAAGSSSSSTEPAHDEVESTPDSQRHPDAADVVRRTARSGARRTPRCGSAVS